MCLIGLAWRTQPELEFLLVGNRDEFYARASSAAEPREQPFRIGGRDLLAGGSWLEFAPAAGLATVTNVRQGLSPELRPRSRGALVSDFVGADIAWSDYAAERAAQAAEYGGFNLLAWRPGDMHFASNSPVWQQRPLEPGVYGLSNASLDSPWPKVTRARQVLNMWLQRNADDLGSASFAPLLDAFAERQPAADADLPDTGVGLDRERLLSPLFLAGDTYGTRCTTVILCLRDGHWRFVERRFGARGQWQGESVWSGRGDHIAS